MALSRTEASAGQKPRLNNMRRNSIEGRHLDIHRRPRSMEAATRNFLTSAMAANRFCARLSPQQFDAIIDTMSYYHFEPGSVVVREGEEGYHFFVLQDSFAPGSAIRASSAVTFRQCVQMHCGFIIRSVASAGVHRARTRLQP